MKYIIFLFAIIFMCCGCVGPRFNSATAKCKKECASTQKNNVGSSFIWSDFQFTFGKCTCVSRSGEKEYFYIGEKEL
jgi:hypothetical protein